ncbi:MAG: 5'-nucleotidase C-terminal domain-containing protein [SAR324 cluster bacterium]|nr:5'-nucleotidase C-terminal domain-containing protein [SAR324 cluster bacterium]
MFFKAFFPNLAAVLCIAWICAGSIALAASDVEQIRIIGTNDIHSYLRPIYYRYLDETKPWGPQSREGNYIAKAGLVGKVGGMAHVATMIQNLRDEKPGKTLLLDAGDTWHGAGISVFDKGVSMVDIMNAIGYDVMAPGNWEFIYPKEHLLALIERAKFPVIAYNVTDKEFEDPIFDSYVIKQVGKLKVAVIGMTYPWTALTSAVDGSAKWWKFGIKEEEARDLIEEIRADENPDLLVFVSHGGFGLDQKFAKRVDDIDVFFSGHTHDEIFDPVVWNDTIIFQAGAHGKFVASLDVDVREKNVVGYQYQLHPVIQNKIPADPKIKKMVDDAYRPHQEKLDEVIGETKTMLYRRDYWQSPLGNLLTDALRETMKTDIAFFPAWRYGATLLPGKITVEDVYNIIPTNGHISTYKMRGKEIKSLLENILGGVADADPYTRVGGDMIRFSGLKIRYNLSRKTGDQISSITVGETPLSLDKIYSIASVQTRFHNNPLFGATYVKEWEKIFAEELVQYIRSHSPILAPLDERIMSDY